MLIHNRLPGNCFAAASFLVFWIIDRLHFEVTGSVLLFIMSTQKIWAILRAHYYKENWSRYIVCIVTNWNRWCLHCQRFEPATLAFSQRNKRLNLVLNLSSMWRREVTQHFKEPHNEWLALKAEGTAANPDWYNTAKLFIWSNSLGDEIFITL